MDEVERMLSASQLSRYTGHGTLAINTIGPKRLTMVAEGNNVLLLYLAHGVYNLEHNRYK